MPFHSDLVFDPSNSQAIVTAFVAFSAMAGRKIVRRKDVEAAHKTLDVD